jgi:hypothetical protein
MATTVKGYNTQSGSAHVIEALPIEKVKTIYAEYYQAAE